MLVVAAACCPLLDDPSPIDLDLVFMSDYQVKNAINIIADRLYKVLP